MDKIVPVSENSADVVRLHGKCDIGNVLLRALLDGAGGAEDAERRQLALAAVCYECCEWHSLVGVRAGALASDGGCDATLEHCLLLASMHTVTRWTSR